MKSVSSFLTFLVLFTLNIPIYCQVDSAISQSEEKVILPNDLHELETECLELIANMYGMIYEISGLLPS